MAPCYRPLTDYFSGTGRAVGRMCVCVCACQRVWTVT